MLEPSFGNPLDRIDLPQGSTIIAAVSGGSDSTALLHLLKQSAEQRRLFVRLVAATVDHGLRPGSAEEARAVGIAAGKLGVEHHILAWTGEKPKSGVQNAARFARHTLLANLAQETGAIAVLTGHTLDDQVETILMREARGSGPGLSGIAPATLFSRKVWFVRPLLASTRQDLRDWLGRSGVNWLEDPGNDNPDFERVAVRKRLAASPDRAWQTARALELAAAAAAERQLIARQAAQLIATRARYEAGTLFLDRIGLDTSDATTHALRILLAAAGELDLLPDFARTHNLLERIVAADKRRNFSLARTVIIAAREELMIRRETRGKQPSLVSKPPQSSPWGQFLPVFELEPAIALARLVSGAIPPPLPWKLP